VLRLNVPGVVSRLIVPQIVPRILPVAGLGIVASFLRPALEAEGWFRCCPTGGREASGPVALHLRAALHAAAACLH